MSLPGRILAVHGSLERAGVPHAFGGALALAWCTQRARGTIDIDVNLFVGLDDVPGTLGGLPTEVRWDDTDVARIEGDGQARLWWDTTPVDVFFNTTAFHEAAAERSRREPFGGVAVPFLACRDLAVFKAFFDRPKDWVDLAEMAEAGTLDVEAVLGVLVAHLGGTDHRIERLRALG